MENTKEIRRASMLLLKEYCNTFKLQPVTAADELKFWEAAHGPLLVAAFLPSGGAPVAWVSSNGVLWIEQDEDLIQPNEPAIVEADPTLMRVAIENKKPIHSLE